MERSRSVTITVNIKPQEKTSAVFCFKLLFYLRRVGKFGKKIILNIYE